MTNPPYYGPAQPAWGPPPSPAPKPSRAPMIVAFVGIFIAIALGVVALLRPAAQAAAPADVAPQYSEQEVAEAKKAVCEAHDLINRASTKSGGQKSDDQTLTFVIAVNVRLTGALAGSYMITELERNAATPPTLTLAVQDLALFYQKTTLLQLSDATKAELDEAYIALNNADEKVVAACK
jgi:hypothetical protein